MSTLIVWYDHPLAGEDDPAAGTHLVEVVTGSPPTLAPGYRVAGWVECAGEGGAAADAETAAAEVPLLLLERGIRPRWSVYSVRDEADRGYPLPAREWRRLPHAIPGQEWPPNVEFGGCLFCSATGVCPDCGGAAIYHDAGCICATGGQCPVCEGTRVMPAAPAYRSRVLGAYADREQSEEFEREREERQRRFEEG
jgi:hypothetical protein